MTFFARPDLSNIQFKQLEGSVLTLSGTTQIANVSGLTLSNGLGGFVPISLEGAAQGVTDYWSLSYDPVDGVVKLMDISGGTGVGVYLGASPTTCTVGGLNENTDIYGTGFTCILEMMLVPTVEPIVLGPSQTFQMSPATSIFEIGEPFTVVGTSSFCAGSATPHYDSNGTCVSSCIPRAGNPFEYVYDGNLQLQTAGVEVIASSSCNNTHTITPPPRIDSGNNSWVSCVRYSSGETIYDSSGGVFQAALPAGHITTSRNFCGIFPYYWGRWRTTTSTPAGQDRPTRAQIEDCINYLNELRSDTQPTTTVWNDDGNTTCIVVAPSTGTITINFDSNPEDYLWFAIYDSNPIKTCWYVTESNSSLIGGAVNPGGNLFPSPTEIDMVNSDKWDEAPSVSGNQTFKLYISNYQSRFVLPMQIRNS